MKVNEILRSIRQQRKLSIQNLADELEISYSTYQNYETDSESKIQLSTLEQIAKIHKMNLIDLLSFGEDDELGSKLYEPSIPYVRKKVDTLKLIIELDGTEKNLKYWFTKLEAINATWKN